MSELIPKGQSPAALVEADWNKARANWMKALADLQKAWANWNKAKADCEKAKADWKKVEMDKGREGRDE